MVAGVVGKTGRVGGGEVTAPGARVVVVGTGKQGCPPVQASSGAVDDHTTTPALLYNTSTPVSITASTNGPSVRPPGLLRQYVLPPETMTKAPSLVTCRVGWVHSLEVMGAAHTVVEREGYPLYTASLQSPSM